jgi:hypothetical protein
VPTWSNGSGFVTVTRTVGELSIICAAAGVPAAVKHDAGWRLLRFQGPFPFSETGVLSSVLAPLAAAKISILAVATFDTDYLLVKQAQLDATVNALRAAGHTVLRDD